MEDYEILKTIINSSLQYSFQLKITFKKMFELPI